MAKIESTNNFILSYNEEICKHKKKITNLQPHDWLPLLRLVALLSLVHASSLGLLPR